MNRIALAAAAILALTTSPSFAADKLACNDEGMMKLEMMMKEKMEMKLNTEMATMAKKEGKMDDCAMHLNMAQEELMKAK